jgi:pimeloyl-ACP methyl ester carboxylesterase
MVGIEAQSIQLSFGSISWFEIGEGKPPMFLHGFPDTPLTFSGQIEFFAKHGFRCMAPYLPGYGSSSHSWQP